MKKTPVTDRYKGAPHPRKTLHLPGIQVEATTELLQQIDDLRIAIADLQSSKSDCYVPTRPDIVRWLVGKACQELRTAESRDNLMNAWKKPNKIRAGRAGAPLKG